jgi:hypothetical protein
MISAVAETPTFPADLLDLQRRLHQARHDYTALCAVLPWSVEPDPGWPGTAHPHTGEVTGGRPASPGWTDEQKVEHGRLFTLVQELAGAVMAHEYWATLPKDGTVVMARTQLKHHAGVQPADAEPAAATAAVESIAA